MQPYKPAIVYTPGISKQAHRRVDAVLQDRRLYRLNLTQEAPETLSLPVTERPVLQRFVFDAATGFADVFVTDHITSLGHDPTSQAAVAGVLMSYGTEVLVMDEPLSPKWYQAQVKNLDYAAVAALMDILTDVESGEALALGWKRIWPSPYHVVPQPRWYDESRLRVRDLIDDDGLSFTEAANRLMVDGYRNAEGRVLWYTQAVRKAYEAGL